MKIGCMADFARAPLLLHGELLPGAAPADGSARIGKATALVLFSLLFGLVVLNSAPQNVGLHLPKHVAVQDLLAWSGQRWAVNTPAAPTAPMRSSWLRAIGKSSVQTRTVAEIEAPTKEVVVAPVIEEVLPLKEEEKSMLPTPSFSTDAWNFQTTEEEQQDELAPLTLSEFVTTPSLVRVPRMIYGIEGKPQDKIEGLIYHAARAGYRGFDVAGQSRRDVDPEAAAGAALATLFKLGVRRENLFIQTRVNLTFTKELYPYASVADQVERSIAHSLSSLGLDYIDSLLLHSPHEAQTMEAWREMEYAVKAGLVLQLGISDAAYLQQIGRLHAGATVKPAVIEQHVVAETDAERKMRDWCDKEGVLYQSFKTLSANSKAILTKAMHGVAKKYDVRPPVLFYRTIMEHGEIPIISTSAEEGMKEFREALKVPLSTEDAEVVLRLRRGEIIRNSFLRQLEIADWKRPRL